MPSPDTSLCGSLEKSTPLYSDSHTENRLEVGVSSNTHALGMHWTTAAQCCSAYKDFTLIPLRAVFGGSPCPAEWIVISETTADLANMLMNHPEWDPDEIRSPYQHMIPPPSLCDESTSFAEALPLMVDIPISNVGTTDVYIDDTISINLSSHENNKRAGAAIPLAIHILGRSVFNA